MDGSAGFLIGEVSGQGCLRRCGVRSALDDPLGGVGPDGGVGGGGRRILEEVFPMVEGSGAFDSSSSSSSESSSLTRFTALVCLIFGRARAACPVIRTFARTASTTAPTTDLRGDRLGESVGRPDVSASARSAGSCCVETTDAVDAADVSGVSGTLCGLARPQSRL